MLIRISLIVAILAGLAVGGLNFLKVKEKITTLQANLETETEAHKEFESKYNVAKKDLDKTTAELKQTKTELEATTAAKEKAETDLAAQTKRADKLTEDLNKTRQERDTAQAGLGGLQGDWRHAPADTRHEHGDQEAAGQPGSGGDREQGSPAEIK